METITIGTRDSCVLQHDEEEVEQCLWSAGLNTAGCVLCLAGAISGSGGVATVLCAGLCTASQIYTGETTCDTCEVKVCVADPTTRRDIDRDAFVDGSLDGEALICEDE